MAWAISPLEPRRGSCWSRQMAPVPVAKISGGGSSLGAQAWGLDVTPLRPPPADGAVVKACCLLFARGWRIQWSIVPEVSEVVVSRGMGSVARGARLYLPVLCGGRGSPCQAGRGRGGGQPPPPGAAWPHPDPHQLMPERPSRAWARLRGRQVGLAGPGLT